MSQQLSPYIVLSAILFSTALVGFVTRRNLIVMFLTLSFLNLTVLTLEMALTTVDLP